MNKITNDTVNYKKGHIIVNDSFAFKPDDLPFKKSNRRLQLVSYPK